jgi:hypothetical protein
MMSSSHLQCNFDCVMLFVGLGAKDTKMKMRQTTRVGALCVPSKQGKSEGRGFSHVPKVFVQNLFIELMEKQIETESHRGRGTCAQARQPSRKSVFVLTPKAHCHLSIDPVGGVGRGGGGIFGFSLSKHWNRTQEKLVGMCIPGSYV